MKLFPCLTIASLCAAFVGCSTTQTVSFEPENTAQDGVTVSIDGKTLGVVPVEFETMRTETAKAHQVVFSKPGYRSEVAVIESYEDTDGLQSFMDSYPIPELLPVPAAPAAEPAPKPAVEPAPEPAVEPAPVPAPAPEEEPEVEDVEDVEDEEPIFEEEVEDEEDVEEPAPEPADEPAPEPAEEPDAEEVDEVEDVEEVDEPADEPAPEPADEDVEEPSEEPAAEPADAEDAPAASDLDPTRTLKDIEADLKSLVAQRQNGQLSEAEFQKACAELEKEVRTRYGK